MSFNGSGTYTPPGANFPAVSATLIKAADYNAVINDIASALSQCLIMDGQRVPSANLPMGGFKHTGVASATAADQYVAFGQLSLNSGRIVGNIAGTSSAITASPTIPETSYIAGAIYRFNSGVDNAAGAVTLNISGLGAKNFSWQGSTTLPASIIRTGYPVECLYDGTNFIIISTGQSEFPAGTALVFYQAAAPNGWTKSAANNDKALRVVSGGSGGSAGGSTAFSTVFASRTPTGTVGNTTLTTAQLAVHAHTIESNNAGTFSGWSGYGTNAAPAPISTVDNAGSSSSHNHSFTGNAMDFAVQYCDVIICTKN